MGGRGDLKRENRLEVGLVEAGVGGAGVGLRELGVDTDPKVPGAVREIQLNVVGADEQQPRPLPRLSAGDFGVRHIPGR